MLIERVEVSLQFHILQMQAVSCGDLQHQSHLSKATFVAIFNWILKSIFPQVKGIKLNRKAQKNFLVVQL